MFRNIIKRTLALSVRHSSTATPKERWDLHVGVLIERLPIVSKALNDIESNFMVRNKLNLQISLIDDNNTRFLQKTLSQIEFENSLKGDHEIRKEKDKLQQELIKSGKLDVELDADARSLQTAQDFEDLNQDELSKFKFALRATDDDKANNLKSLNRKLDDTLMLVLAHDVNKSELFLLPQDQWQEGESLRQTAERIVKDKIGTDLKVQFYGHAPCGFYKYKYKPAEKKAAVGSKTFFYRAAYKSGEVNNSKAKFEWINEEELKGKVRESYFKSVSQFLIS